MEDNYKSLVLEASIFSRVDADGRILDVNDAFCAISGYSREEIIGQTYSIIHHPLASTHIFTELWEVITQNKKWSGIIRNCSKDGKDFYISTTIVPVVEDGIGVQYLSISFDVTEHVEQRLELQWQEHITDTILDNQKGILALYSNIGGFIRVNNPFYEAFEIEDDGFGNFDFTSFQQEYEFIDELFLEEEGYLFRQKGRDLLDF